MIYTGNEIAVALGHNWDATADCIRGLSDAEFEAHPEGKWSPGQHLEHLLRSARPLRKALGYPKFVIRLVAGRPNRASRTFEETQARYNERLAQGGAASGRYIPPEVPASRKESLLTDYARERDRMLFALRKRWKEKALDQYLLPHPLLGKVTVREMMFFTTFHTAHHLGIIQRDQQQ